MTDLGRLTDVCWYLCFFIAHSHRTQKIFALARYSMPLSKRMRVLFRLMLERSRP